MGYSDAYGRRPMTAMAGESCDRLGYLWPIFLFALSEPLADYPVVARIPYAASTLCSRAAVFCSISSMPSTAKPGMMPASGSIAPWPTPSRM